MYRGDQTPNTIRYARELLQKRLDDNLHETVSSIKNMATMDVATAGIGVATIDLKAVPSSKDVICRLNSQSSQSSIGNPYQKPVCTSIFITPVTSTNQAESSSRYSKPHCWSPDYWWQERFSFSGHWTRKVLSYGRHLSSFRLPSWSKCVFSTNIGFPRWSDPSLAFSQSFSRSSTRFNKDIWKYPHRRKIWSDVRSTA